MKSSTELEIELREAQKAETEAYAIKQEQEASKWIGKCYSSHLFQRVPKNFKSINVRKVTGVKYENKRIWYKGINIEMFFFPYQNRFKIDIEDRTHADTPFPTWISSWSHEITEKQFDAIYREAQAHADTYFDKLAKIFKQSEYISQGDHTDESSKLKWVMMRNQMLDLTAEKGYESVKDILSWNRHPYIYETGMLIYNKESIELVKDIADQIETHSRKWGGSVWERDAPRVAKLRAFYKEHIVNF